MSKITVNLVFIALSYSGKLNFFNASCDTPSKKILCELWVYKIVMAVNNYCKKKTFITSKCKIAGGWLIALYNRKPT